MLFAAGEYDARTAAYYARAPKASLEATAAAVDDLPPGMLGGGSMGGASSVAERVVGEDPRRAGARAASASVGGRAPVRRDGLGGLPLGGPYQASERIAGLDEGSEL